LETEAKLFIQDCIKQNELELAWSFILDFENSANPFDEQRDSIWEWKTIAKAIILAEDEIKILAKRFEKEKAIKPKDALHLSCAIFIMCDYFLTTDKDLVKKAKSIPEISVLNPIDFVLEWEEK
jgi:predicted nucleic acid-binding protein